MHKIVSKNWAYSIRGLRFFGTQHKLSQIKTQLKEWAKRNYGHTQNKLVENCEKIKSLEERLWAQTFNPFLVQRINRLILQREKLLLFGQSTWGEFSRNQWLPQGDRNSRFFHNRMKKCTINTSIYCLKSDMDQWVDSAGEIQNLLSNSFQERFSSSSSSQRPMDLSFLTPIVSQVEPLLQKKT